MSLNIKMSPAHKQWAILKGFATREEEDARAEKEAQVKCTWNEIGNKPEAFKPEEHTHEQYATLEVVEQKVADLVDSAPEALNTLKELADALATKGDATAIVEQISKVETKVDAISLDSLGYVEPDLSVFALKTEIPVLPEDHVTQDELAEAIIKVEEQIPSIKGLASEDFVTTKVAAVEKKIPVLPTDHVTKTELNSAIKEVRSLIPTLPTDHVTKLELANAVSDLEDKIPSHDAFVSFSDFEYNGETRKTIQLNNYDNISGVTTTGDGVNLAMISKWDVADFGAPSVHMNLNTKMHILEDGSEYPAVTINDKPEWAIATVEYVGKQVNGLASEDFVNEQILAVEKKIPTIPSHESYAIKTEVAESFEAVNTAITNVEAVSRSTYATKVELAENMVNVVKQADVTTKDAVGRDINYKTIQMGYMDSLSTTASSGERHDIVTISKRNEINVGTQSLILNLNTRDYITVNNDEILATKTYVGSAIDTAARDLVKTSEIVQYAKASAITDLNNTIANVYATKEALKTTKNEAIAAASGDAASKYVTREEYDVAMLRIAELEAKVAELIG